MASNSSDSSGSKRGAEILMALAAGGTEMGPSEVTGPAGGTEMGPSEVTGPADGTEMAGITGPGPAPVQEPLGNINLEEMVPALAPVQVGQCILNENPAEVSEFSLGSWESWSPSTGEFGEEEVASLPSAVDCSAATSLAPIEKNFKNTHWTKEQKDALINAYKKNKALIEARRKQKANDGDDQPLCDDDDQCLWDAVFQDPEYKNNWIGRTWGAVKLKGSKVLKAQGSSNATGNGSTEVMCLDEAASTQVPRSGSLTFPGHADVPSYADLFDVADLARAFEKRFADRVNESSTTLINFNTDKCSIPCMPEKIRAEMRKLRMDCVQMLGQFLDDTIGYESDD